MRRVFVCFLEEIEDTKKTFRNYLTFNGKRVGNGSAKKQTPLAPSPGSYGSVSCPIGMQLICICLSPKFGMTNFPFPALFWISFYF
jgi:hypothetical protein